MQAVPISLIAFLSRWSGSLSTCAMVILAALIASGDLPADTQVLAGQAGSGSDEGAAMMEIVHDMAPGSKIIFATAGPNVAAFASNIIALQHAHLTLTW